MRAAQGLYSASEACPFPALRGNGFCRRHFELRRAAVARGVEKFGPRVQHWNDRTNTELWTEAELEGGLDIDQVRNDLQGALRKMTIPASDIWASVIDSDEITYSVDTEFLIVPGGLLLLTIGIVNMGTREVVLHCRVNYSKPLAALINA